MLVIYTVGLILLSILVAFLVLVATRCRRAFKDSTGLQPRCGRKKKKNEKVHILRRLQNFQSFARPAESHNSWRPHLRTRHTQDINHWYFPIKENLVGIRVETVQPDVEDLCGPRSLSFQSQRQLCLTAKQVFSLASNESNTKMPQIRQRRRSLPWCGQILNEQSTYLKQFGGDYFLERRFVDDLFCSSSFIDNGMHARIDSSIFESLGVLYIGLNYVHTTKSLKLLVDKIIGLKLKQGYTLNTGHKCLSYVIAVNLFNRNKQAKDFLEKARITEPSNAISNAMFDQCFCYNIPPTSLINMMIVMTIFASNSYQRVKLRRRCSLGSEVSMSNSAQIQRDLCDRRGSLLDSFVSIGKTSCKVNLELLSSNQWTLNQISCKIVETKVNITLSEFLSRDISYSDL